MASRRRSGGRVGEEKILDLINSVYDASVDASLWPHFLEKLSALQRGAAVGMVSFSNNDKSGRLSYSVRCDPRWQQTYEEYYAPIDVFIAGLKEESADGVARPGQRIITNSDLVKSEFYTDWMAPQDLFHTIHCVAMRDDQQVVTLGAGRSKSSGSFDQTELKVWDAFIPHVCRAVQIQRINSELASARDTMASGLSRRSVGLLLVSSNGTVIDGNAFAEQLLAKGDGLSIRSNKLVAKKKADQDTLGSLISSALNISLAGERSAGGFMQVWRPSRREPYKMMVVPAREGIPFLGKSTAAAAIYVLDPEMEIDLDVRKLQESFGFTDAETRIVASIMKGLDVNLTAHELGLSRNTVRTHLKRVFEKAGTSRQSQLVLKILSLML